MKKFLGFTKVEWSWALVDWGNSAFATVCMAAVLPVFYKTVAAKGVPNVLSTAYWAYANFLAAFIIALFSPFLGAIADSSSYRKKFFVIFTFLGSIGTFIISLTGEGDYIWVALLYILGTIGFSGSEVFYNSFLPLITSPDRRDKLSAYGYALGYLGGGVLLAFDISVILFPSVFGVSSTLSATKFSFITVSLWWILFSMPFILIVKEKALIAESTVFSIKSKVKEFLKTFYDIVKRPEAFKFLLAFWLYNDGIVTIIKMATAYGVEIGIESKDLIVAILLTQFVAFPFTVIFGHITKRMKTKHAIFIALIVYMGITFWGAFMKTAFEFYILAILVGTVQGGAQSLSRSLYSRLIPKEKSAQFFGLYALSSKFSTILGPLLFGIVAQFTGTGRYAIFVLIVFFIIGGIILLNVKEPDTVSNS